MKNFQNLHQNIEFFHFSIPIFFSVGKRDPDRDPDWQNFKSRSWSRSRKFWKVNPDPDLDPEKLKSPISSFDGLDKFTFSNKLELFFTCSHTIFSSINSRIFDGKLVGSGWGIWTVCSSLYRSPASVICSISTIGFSERISIILKIKQIGYMAPKKGI